MVWVPALESERARVHSCIVVVVAVAAVANNKQFSKYGAVVEIADFFRHFCRDG